MVVLNPYAADSYLIIFKDGKYRAHLPSSIAGKIREMIEQQGKYDGEKLKAKLKVQLSRMEQRNKLNTELFKMRKEMSDFQSDFLRQMMDSVLR